MAYPFLKGDMDTHADARQTPVQAARDRSVMLSEGAEYAGAGEAADG